MTNKLPALYPFYDYARYNKERYGFRVQKITVDAGFTCPNRDGKVGTGGCTYCDNRSFSPTHQRPFEIAQQIEHGIAVSKRRYKNVNHYIVYFQSYSNTYAPLKQLKMLYEQALAYPQVIGLAIGTRPDCLDEETLDYLGELAKRPGLDLTLELGIESTLDSTLERINRCHDYACFENAVLALKERSVPTCAHLILGFPWETHADWMESAAKLSRLPLQFLKIHQLRIIKSTTLGREFSKNPFPILSMEEYAQVLADFLERLRPDMVLQRLSGESQGEPGVQGEQGKKDSSTLAGHFPLALPEFTVYLAQLMNSKGQYQGRLYKI